MGRKENESMSEQPKKSINNGKQFLFWLASYNPATEEIEFSYDVLARIKQVTDKRRSNPFIVFATAIGQPTSGKTAALNHLVKYWDSTFRTTAELQFPTDRSGNSQGIQLLLSDVPRVCGSNDAYLVCLDVVCDPESLAYKPLMEVCYRLSNLVVFTFSRESKSQELVSIEYTANKDCMVAVSFSGYGTGTWASANLRYYENLEALMPFLEGKDTNEDADYIKNIIMTLANVVSISKFPVQVEQAFKVYSNSSDVTNGSKENRKADIYSNLVQSLRENKLRKGLGTSSELVDIFLMMATRAKGELAKANEEQNRNNAAEERPDSDFDVVVNGTARNPFRNSDKAHQRETKSADADEQELLADPPKIQKKSRSTSAGPQCWKDRRSKANLPSKDVDADVPQSSAAARKDQGSNFNGTSQVSSNNNVAIINEVESSGTRSISDTRSSRRSRLRSLTKGYLEEVVHDNKLPRVSAEVSEHFEELSDDESTSNHGIRTPSGETVKLTGSDANPHGASSYFSNHTSGKGGSEKNGGMKFGNAEASFPGAEGQGHQGPEKEMAGNNLQYADSANIKGDISMEIDFEGDTTIKEAASYGYNSPSPVTRDRNLNGNTSTNYRANEAIQPRASTSAESPETKARTALPPTASAPAITNLSLEQMLDKRTTDLLREANTKRLSLQLLTLVGNGQPSFASGFDKMQQWGGYTGHMTTPSSTLDKSAKQMDEALRDLHGIADKYFVKCSYLGADQLKKLQQELKSNLENHLKKIPAEKDHFRKIGEIIMNTVFTAISTKNEAIKESEELLADNICKAAYESYTKVIDQMLRETSFNDKAIKKLHERLLVGVLSSFSPEQKHDSVVWKPLIEKLGNRMKMNLQDVANRNARNVAQLLKKTSTSFKTCQREFDRLFAQKSDIKSLGDLKSHRDSTLAEVLQSAKTIQPSAASKEVKEKLKIYAFSKILKCAASSSPRAAEVLARQCNVTFVYPEEQLAPLTILFEDINPVVLDPRLVLSGGNNLGIIDRTYPGTVDKNMEYPGPGCPWLSISDLAFRDYFYQSKQYDHQVGKAIRPYPCEHPEQIMAVYFREVKNALLSAHHILPVGLTVCVADQASFIAQHRINSAIRMAGLPPPIFTSASGKIQNNISYSTTDSVHGSLVTAGHCLKEDLERKISFQTSSYGSEKELNVCVDGARIHFKFKLPARKNVECILKLRKDGILCEPDIHVDGSEEPISWEMTGPLMPWNHPSLQNSGTLLGQLAELESIQNRPLQLRRNSILNNATVKQETPATPRSDVHTNGHSSHLPNGNNIDFNSPSRRPDQNVNAMKEELGKLIERLEQVLSDPTVLPAVTRRARIKLNEAKTLLESEDVKSAKINLLIQTLKIQINTVTGTAV